MTHFACAHPSVAGGHDAHKALIALSSSLGWAILKVDNFTNYPPFTGQFQALIIVWALASLLAQSNF